MRHVRAWRGHALKRMQAAVEQLKDHDRERVPVLRLAERLGAARHRLGRDVAFGVLVSGKAVAVCAGDAEAVAVEDGDELRVAVDVHVGRLEVDHVVAGRVQRRDRRRQVVRDRHASAEPFGERLGAARTRREKQFEQDGAVQVDARHEKAGRRSARRHRAGLPGGTAVVHDGDGPCNLDIGLPAVFGRAAGRRMREHRGELFAPARLRGAVVVHLGDEVVAANNGVDARVAALSEHVAECERHPGASRPQRVVGRRVASPHVVGRRVSIAHARGVSAADAHSSAGHRQHARARRLQPESEPGRAI